MLWVPKPSLGNSEQPSCFCSWRSVQTLPKGFPRHRKNRGELSCVSVFARRGFSSVRSGGSPRTQPCSTHHPALLLPSPPGPFAPRG